MAEWGGDVVRLQLVVLRCQAGDERAFAQLFEWFNGRTERYLRNLVGDAAEDVQQEVWLAVYRGLRSLTNARAFRTWLFQTTRHRAIDYLRKQKRERELLTEVSSEATEVSEAAEENSTLDLSNFDAVLSELPTAQREALLLRYRDDLSYNEIALIVGVSVGTIRSRLHHAKRRMSELMAIHAREET
jgi:RNA polymerase sigma-70 factor, ECF subfamily